jgi:nucleoside-diphosphate-sugar epimerase
MRLAVFGGTGRTGRLLVERALADGHEVRALARRPPDLEELRTDRLTVVAGDARDADAVRRTVDGAEAVVSALGPRGRADADLLGAAARNIVAAARSAGAWRVVWLTGAGVRAPGDEPKFVDRVFVTVLRLTERALLEDSIAAVEAVRKNGLEATVVRAPRLVDGPPSTTPRGGAGGARVGDEGLPRRRGRGDADARRSRGSTPARCRSSALPSEPLGKARSPSARRRAHCSTPGRSTASQTSSTWTNTPRAPIPKVLRDPFPAIAGRDSAAKEDT